MKRIETTLETLKADIGNFYKVDQHHFIVMNAVEVGEKMEVQWFFADYAYPCEVTAFCTQISPSDEIPTLKGIIDSAWAAEAELVDLMDINVEGTEKGFVLEPDFETGPLRKSK